MAIAAAIVGSVHAARSETVALTKIRASAADGSQASTTEVDTPWGRGVRLSYELADGGWANLSAPLAGRAPVDAPVTLAFAVKKPVTLELKFIAADGGTFGQRVAVAPVGGEWRTLTIYPSEAEHWWGGGEKLGKPASYDLAISGATGAGSVTIARLERGKPGIPSSFGKNANAAAIARLKPPLLVAPRHGPRLDPDRNLPGYGVRQRRSKTLTPEDPLVLAWLEAVQDAGSPARRLLPSTAGGDDGQTFNNALAAMAFARHGERDRMERILDFYRDTAADKDNADPTLQAFYLNGEARGFYQRVALRKVGDTAPMHAFPGADRWMGDMAWLHLAMLDHQRTFGGTRYNGVMRQIRDLLVSWYVDDPAGHGGYVQHGWRRGDAQLHEATGHHEGNIDCFALFTLVGEPRLPQNIHKWLDSQLAGKNDLPLDLYTWRVLALDGRRPELLDVPDFDLRYRKTVPFHGRTLIGPYTGPMEDDAQANVWIEGLGHLACAYAAAGNLDRANFYANQMDAAIIDETIGGQATHGLPYAAIATGDFSWLNADQGFTSTAAWYVLAKHRFNPLRLAPAKAAP